MELAQGGAVAREVCDQDRQAAAGEPAAVPVQEVEAVMAEQIRLEGLGVFVYELAEAEPSPRPSPVSWPYASRMAPMSCIVTSCWSKRSN